MPSVDWEQTRWAPNWAVRMTVDLGWDLHLEGSPVKDLDVKDLAMDEGSLSQDLHEKGLVMDGGSLWEDRDVKGSAMVDMECPPVLDEEAPEVESCDMELEREPPRVDVLLRLPLERVPG